MNKGISQFLALSESERFDLFQNFAIRLETLPNYVEKDYWVCLVLDVLFNQLGNEHPNLLFKGGTSLSKSFGLINRFSEDIDIVVYRDKLGFEGEDDPIAADDLSNRKRLSLFEEVRIACSAYILGELRSELTRILSGFTDGCKVVPDDVDSSGQTLLVHYPTLYDLDDIYVLPQVKIEAGARSALEPSLACGVEPYVASMLPTMDLSVDYITTIAPERTYWDKLLILHGLHCGYRDQQRLPTQQDRISRHFYDAAMITATEIGRAALSNRSMLDAVRKHNLVAFRQAWKRFEEAVPGTIRLVPQPELRAVLEQDYDAMQGMLFGEAPDFGWIMERIQEAEDAANRL